MKMIKVSCINEGCRESDAPPQTIPAYRIIAPGILERLGTLVCDLCGHDLWIEKV